VALAVGHVATRITREENKGAISLGLTWRQVGGPRAVAAMALLAVFLGAYVTMTLVWEDFAYYDNSIFTLGTLKGRNYPTPIWQGQGRFFPLGHQGVQPITSSQSSL
jgi:hypothetical protein